LLEPAGRYGTEPPGSTKQKRARKKEELSWGKIWAIENLYLLGGEGDTKPEERKPEEKNSLSGSLKRPRQLPEKGKKGRRRGREGDNQRETMKEKQGERSNESKER